MALVKRCLVTFGIMNAVIVASAISSTNGAYQAATATDLLESGPSDRRHRAASADSEHVSPGEAPQAQPFPRGAESVPFSNATPELANSTFDGITIDYDHSHSQANAPAARSGVGRPPRHGAQHRSAGNRPRASAIEPNAVVFWCHRCDHTCATVKGLKRHYNDVHDEQIFRCCEQSFYRTERLKKHQLSHHGGLLGSRRQQSRHAHACGLCGAVFVQNFDAFFTHHIGHCRRHAQRRQWAGHLQLAGLLGQDGLRNIWNAVSRIPSIDSAESLRWCSANGLALIARMEGHSWTQSFAVYLEDINDVLQGLLYHFIAWTTQQVEEHGYGIIDDDTTTNATGAALFEPVHPSMTFEPDFNDGVRLAPAAREAAQLLHPSAESTNLERALTDDQHAAYNGLGIEELQDGDGVYRLAVQGLVRNGMQQSEHYLANAPSGLWHAGYDCSLTEAIPGDCDAYQMDQQGPDLDNTHVQDGQDGFGTPQNVRPLQQPALRGSETARTNAERLLLETLQAGVVPAVTSGEGLLCGMHAVVGSLNDLMRRLATHDQQLPPLDVVTVMRSMYVNSVPTRAYADFVELRLRRFGLAPGDGQYEEQWRELTRVDNMGIEQLVALPQFLFAQGLIEREVAVGVLTSGGISLDGSVHEPTAQVFGGPGLHLPVAWIHNDNAELMQLGGGHWSMFVEGGDLPHLLDQPPPPDHQQRESSTGLLPAQSLKTSQSRLEQEYASFINSALGEEPGNAMVNGYQHLEDPLYGEGVLQDTQVAQTGSGLSAHAFDELLDVTQDVQDVVNGTLLPHFATLGPDGMPINFRPSAGVSNRALAAYELTASPELPFELLELASTEHATPNSALIDLDMGSPSDLLDDMFGMHTPSRHLVDA